MKKQLILCIAFLFMGLVMTASTEYHVYLKIKKSDSSEISYPPGTAFIVEDQRGNKLLDAEKLESLGIYEINQPITLFVFTSWDDQPDVYELKSGKLVMDKDHKYYKTSYAYPKDIDGKQKGKAKAGDHFGRPTDGTAYGKTKEGKNYGSWEGNNNGVSLKQSRFFDYDEQTGYDASLEFSNGVIFYYKKGEATAWQDGKELDINGKYLIKTRNGMIKLSYNATTKKTWWIFDKDLVVSD